MNLDSLNKELEKAIDHLHQELKKIHTGRANTAMLDHIQVEAYGVNNPLKNIANVSTADAKTLVIAPWDKMLLETVEKTLQTSDLGINPLNDGSVIRLTLPDLSEERRRELVKQSHNLGEEAKISVRNIRHKKMTEIKQDENLSDDQKRDLENEVQDIIRKSNHDIDAIIQKKESDLMKV